MLLLWTFQLLLLPTGAWGQSGDRDSDMEPTVHCRSHISYFEGNTITCQLVPGQDGLEDDEDNGNDTIKTITACCCQLGKNTQRCVNASGETVSSKNLNPNSLINLTVLSTRGRHVQTQLDLRKIIKPKSPQVWNVTLNKDSAVVQIQIPYYREYLKLQNLQFQVQLWSDKSNMRHNMTSDSMKIGMDHLHKGTQYHIKVRAIPVDYLQGTWSEWSHTYSFKTPSADVAGSIYIVVLDIILLVAVIICVVFLSFWKNKTFAYMWPSIPHPKITLVQICRPNITYLLTYTPVEINSLDYCPEDQSEAVSHDETQPVPPLSTGGTEETPCSTQTTHTSISSVPTEELELLSQSISSDGEQSLPGPAQAEQHEGDMFTSGQQEDSYVTMSNFYQIRTTGMLIRANTHPQI